MKFSQYSAIQPGIKNYSFKNILVVPFFITLGSSGAFAQDISLYDYQEASSAIDEAYFTGSFSTEKNRGDAQSAYNLNLGASLEKVFSSPDRDTTFKADVLTNVSRGSDSGDTTVKQYKAKTSLSVDNYFEPNSNRGFWYAKGSIAADDTFSDLQTTLSAGVGYGRVVNVTAMAKAIRLIEELVKRGAIDHVPNKQAHQQIAAIIDNEKSYKSEHGSRSKFYQQHWIGAIEQVLIAQGIVRGVLSANGILAMRDVLIDEKISVRKYGWKVRAGLAYVGRNFEGIKNKPALELGAQYHLPFNNRTQFSNQATLTSILDSDSDAYTFNNDMSLTFEVDDRLDWINSWGLNINRSANDGDRVLTQSLTSTLAYEVDNSLDLTVSAGLSHSSGNNNINPGDVLDGTDRKFNVGVRYRLR